MSSYANVEVVINEDGTYTLEVKGVPGTKCTDITQLLTQGVDVTEQQYTSEFCLPDFVPNEIASTDEE